MEEGNNPSLKD